MLKAAAKLHNIYYLATERAIHLTYCGSAIGIFCFHSPLSTQALLSIVVGWIFHCNKIAEFFPCFLLPAGDIE
jgi:uncharacterized protein (DUF2062 family)